MQYPAALRRFEPQVRVAAGRWLETGRETAGRLRPVAARMTAPLRVLTGSGRAVLLGSIATWVVADRFGWLELSAVAAAGLISLLLCAVFVLGRAPVRVEFLPERTRAVAGQSIEAGLVLTGRARGALLPVDLELPIGPAGRQTALPIPAPRLHRGRDVSLDELDQDSDAVAAASSPSARPPPCGPIRSGCCAAPCSGPQSWELIVHPRTVPLRPLDSGLLRDLEGRTADQISASDLEFHTLRDYVRGDDRRHIHWRSSARTASLIPGGQRFLVRQYLQTRNIHLLLVVDGDVAAYPDPDQFETAVGAAASVARQAIGDRIGATLVVADRTVRDLTDEDALFDACARAEFGRGGELAALVGRGSRIAPQANAALLFTGPNADGPQLRRVRAQLRPEVATGVLRIDPASPSGRTAGPGLTVFTLAALADLPRLIGAGGIR